MFIVLPPSETKVSGGEPGTCLELAALSFPHQNAVRESLIQDLIELSADVELAKAALKLGVKGAGEIVRNSELRTSPVLPALERYTGVLYDALGYSELPRSQREWVDQSVGVFSALFGLIRSIDPIPAYRLSFDSRLPSGKPGKHWGAVGDNVWAQAPGFTLDLRSEGYRSLAPVPEGRGVFVALVKPGPRGARPALGHTNKAVKGELVKRLAATDAQVESLEDFVAWGSLNGYECDASSYDQGRVDLVISDR